ncbi:MAG: protein TolQ [Pseudomonadota bacterium]
MANGEVVQAAIAPASDISLVGLLFEADLVVKAVLVILVLASVWSWAVIFEKSFTLGSARKKAKAFENAFWSGRPDDLDGRPGQGASDAASRVFAAASREWADARRGVANDLEAGAIITRAERSMRATIDRELGQAQSGLGVLATVGSASPFIGLFGTVWGIMNAFLKIGQQQDTSLGVVAGPIAEALFATALGLVAAIPATIFYNKFTTDAAKFADQLDSFSQDILVRLSRRASDGLTGA